MQANGRLRNRFFGTMSAKYNFKLDKMKISKLLSSVSHTNYVIDIMPKMPKITYCVRDWFFYFIMVESILFVLFMLCFHMFYQNIFEAKYTTTSLTFMQSDWNCKLLDQLF